ncbi:hypothetical protein ACHAPJ_011210 [Fusarium lateritium]
MGSQIDDWGVDPSAIAIVGLACRLPGDARNEKGFWELVSKGRSAYSEASNRWNVDAYYHASRGRLNTSVSRGAHFVTQDIHAFDAGFFKISPHEVGSLDPQQRFMLEVSYEAFENAGMPMEKISGSQTGCFVGNFSTDWREALSKDVESLPKHAYVGSAPEFLSNRVSWFFNLKGPSMSLTTACSSSLVALHTACQSLKTGDCNMALAGGVNLLLSPDVFLHASNQGFLARDGKCKTFDAAGDGYGRGEGCAVVVLKKIEDALRDGDNIRAVIRGSGSNQDGKTRSITRPCPQAQADLIRSVYRRAGLDMADTSYFEAHVGYSSFLWRCDKLTSGQGTGTKVGDPIELEAISKTVSGAQKGRKLLVGSTKPNVGHLESVAGIVGVIKGVLAIEKGMIPPSILFNNPNPDIPFEKWNIEIPRSATPWPSGSGRRFSVNSFGAGGTNAHAVIEGLQNYLVTGRQEDLSRDESLSAAAADRQRIFTLRSEDREGLSRQREALLTHLQHKLGTFASGSEEEQYLSRLMHTLEKRRSCLSWACCYTASSLSDLITSLQDPNITALRSGQPFQLNFIFSGQGAQWARMGIELLKYPAFRESVAAADAFLKETLACKWSALEELQKNAEVSRVNDSSFAQTLLTVIQVAQVELLESWNILPEAVVGHSSGEVAAAFCIGALSREQAWTISSAKASALLHLESPDLKLKGSMLAAGCSEAEANELLARVKTGKAVVACVNSPTSVTISGDDTAIYEMQKLLQDSKIFERKLRVDHAYHSHHMQKIASVFEEKMGPFKPQTSNKKVRMYSSVTGELIQPWDLTPSYWVTNMVSPVLFSKGVEAILESADGGQSSQILVEIGPHSTLKGPLQQIFKQRGVTNYHYQPSMIRGQDASQTATDCAAQLNLLGVPVNIGSNQKTRQKPLIDLPGYVWNHTHSYSNEPRLSKEQRMRRSAKRDLIGPSVPCLIPNTHIWRGILRCSEEPWIKDHCIQGAVVYPAAGFVAMAIEGIRQIVDHSRSVKFFNLRDVDISQAAVIPEGSDLEAILALTPKGEGTSSSTNWWKFTVSTCINGASVRENCQGLIQVEYEATPDSAMERELMMQTQTVLNEAARIQNSCADVSAVSPFYERLHATGLQYGSTFQCVSDIAFGDSQSSCVVTVPDSGSSFIPPLGEIAHIIHPSTLDAILHSVLAATTKQGGLTKSAMVPSKIGQISVNASIPHLSGERLKAISAATKYGFHGMKSSAHVCNVDLNRHYLSLEDVQWSPIETLAPDSEAGARGKKLCFANLWEPALQLLNAAELQKWVDAQEPKKRLDQVLDLVCAGSNSASILEIVPTDGSCMLLDLFQTSPTLRNASLTVSTYDSTTAEVLQQEVVEEHPHIRFMTVSELENSDFQNQFDIILTPLSDQFISSFWYSLLKVENSYLLQHDKSHLVVHPKAKELCTNAIHQNSHDYGVLVIESPSASKPLKSFGDLLVKKLQSLSYTPQRFDWGCGLDLAGKRCLFLLDHSASFLQNIGEAEFSSFQGIISAASEIFWVAPSTSANTGLVSGFSRVVRNELSKLRFVTIQTEEGLSETSRPTVEMVTRIVTSQAVDDEYLLEDGIIKISRVCEDKSMNGALADTMGNCVKSMALSDSKVCLRLGVQTPGMLSTLRFEPDLSLNEGLADDEVEIHVHSSGINFRDVLTAMGEIPDDHLGREAAGIVTQLGRSTSRLRVGDRVCCLGSGAHKTILRVKEAFCQVVPDSVTFDEAASLPVVYCTAYHALVNLARVEPEQSILIHCGAGGVGQAAIQVAKWLGLEIFTTVGSLEKRESTRALYGIPDDHIFSSRDPSFAKAIMRATNGRGVDSVLNSLSGEMLRQTWNCLAPFGTFVEIGMKDILNNSGLEMRTFIRNATFCFFNLESMERDPRRVGRIMESAFNLIRRGILLPVTPVTSYPVFEVEKAFRLMQAGKHRGKMTLSFKPEHVVPVLQNGDGIIRLTPDATYLLVGGLGGLGRSLSNLLVGSGARHLCFLSRSGAASVQAKTLVSDLKTRGVNVYVIESDVSDETSLQDALNICSKTMPPVKGVIHAAMVLRDAIFENMSHQQWVESLRPKVQGTANLNKNLPADLDFFILLSSFSGFIGNRGQSNYAAGCAYQDAVAEARQKLGLKALSIDLGIIRDVGVLAEKDIPKSIIPWVKPFGIGEKELHLLIKLAIGSQLAPDWRSRNAQVITGLATGATAHSSGVSPYYLEDPRFSRVAVRHLEDEADSTIGAEKGISAQLLATATTTAEAQQAVSSILLEHLGKLLQIPTTEIDMSRPLFTYGVDSLVAMEMRNWIVTEFKSDLALFDITAHVPITDLVSSITAKSELMKPDIKTG